MESVGGGFKIDKTTKKFNKINNEIKYELESKN